MIMSANGPSDFKFSGSGEEQQDAILQRKRKNRRVAKSGARSTIFFIFLLLILGGLFAFAYMDIKQRVARLEEAGERNVQEMVREMEAQVAQLTERYDEMQKSLTKKVFPMDEIFLALESSTSALEEQLKGIETRMTSLREAQASKADKTALDAAVTEITEALPAFQKKIEQELDEKIGTLDDRVAAVETVQAEKLAALEKRRAAYEERLTALSSAVQEYVDAAAATRKIVDESLTTLSREIAALKTEASALTSVAVDQKTLDEALDSQRSALSRRIQDVAAAVDKNQKTIGSIRSRVNAVAETAEASARALRESPPKTIRVPPQPGTFLEQDIQ